MRVIVCGAVIKTLPRSVPVAVAQSTVTAPVAILVRLAIGRLAAALDATRIFPEEASTTITLSDSWADAIAGSMAASSTSGLRWSGTHGLIPSKNQATAWRT